MSLKKDRTFVRFISEFQDFISDIIFLENKCLLSGLRLVLKILRQMANLGKQNSRLTEHKRFPHTFLKLMLLREPALNGFGQQEVFCNLRSVLKV